VLKLRLLVPFPEGDKSQSPGSQQRTLGHLAEIRNTPKGLDHSPRWRPIQLLRSINSSYTRSAADPTITDRALASDSPTWNCLRSLDLMAAGSL
jgi:hypothetical protein